MEPDETGDAQESAGAKDLSKVPSWITLGFIVGALTVLMIESGRHSGMARDAGGSGAENSLRVAPAAAPAPKPAGPVGGPTSAPSLDIIEAVFSVWGRHAVWKDDMTEVALWNRSTHAFSDCFEVLRIGDDLYFRSIPHLTRPVLNHGVEVESPLEFTDTEEGRAQWLSEAHRETWKAFAESARESLGSPTDPRASLPPSPAPLKTAPTGSRAPSAPAP